MYSNKEQRWGVIPCIELARSRTRNGTPNSTWDTSYLSSFMIRIHFCMIESAIVGLLSVISAPLTFCQWQVWATLKEGTLTQKPWKLSRESVPAAYRHPAAAIYKPQRDDGVLRSLLARYTKNYKPNATFETKT